MCKSKRKVYFLFLSLSLHKCKCIFFLFRNIHLMCFVACLGSFSVKQRTLYRNRISYIAICIYPIWTESVHPNTWNKSSRWTRLATILLKHLLYLTFRPTTKSNWEYSERCKLVTPQWIGMKYTAQHSTARNWKRKSERERKGEREKRDDHAYTDPSNWILA